MNFAQGRSPRLQAAVVLLFLCSALLFTPAYGSGADSVVTVAVESGLTHLSITKPGPYTLNVLVLDLFAKNLQVESYRPVGLVPTSQQVLGNDREGHRVVAAINADFFSFKSGWPVNNQVVNGEWVVGLQTQRSHLAIDSRGKPHIERLGFNGWLRPNSGRTYPIAGVNDVHRNNAIILHTSFSDTATSFWGPGMTYLLKLVSRQWSVGDTLKMVVNKNSVADMTHILIDQAVLWIGGGSSVWSAREDVRVGDTVLVFLGLQPELRNVRTIVGGAGTVLYDGKPTSDSVNLKESVSVTFLRARHPRTFVGFDRDTTKLFFCTVDGRQQSSIGMSYQEMADFLLSLGVWNAINLDGGGSTTMVVRGKIVNSPSDKTGERPVANSLQVITVTPSLGGK